MLDFVMGCHHAIVDEQVDVRHTINKHSGASEN